MATTHHLIGPLITCSGCVRRFRFKVGLNLDLVATKHWLAPIRLLRVPLILITSVEWCNSKLLSFSWYLSWSLCRLFTKRFRCLLLWELSAFLALHSPFAILPGKRFCDVGRKIAPREY
jgi:hypothetical protein